MDAVLRATVLIHTEASEQQLGEVLRDFIQPLKTWMKTRFSCSYSMAANLDPEWISIEFTACTQGFQFYFCFSYYFHLTSQRF